MSDPKMFDLDAWIQGAKRPERTAKVFARADLVADLNSLQDELAAATDDRFKVGIRKRINALKSELEASAHTFRFRALSQAQSDQIDAENPIPGEDEADDATRTAAANRRMLATIAVQSVDPKMTVDQVVALHDAIGEVEFLPLVNAVVQVNSEATVDAPFWRATSQNDQDS